MNSLQFKKNEFKKLCAIIGYKPSIVSEVIANIDKYYYEKIEVKKDKKTGEVKFHIIAAVIEERKMNWPDFTGNMVIPSDDTIDPVADALKQVRGDREL